MQLPSYEEDSSEFERYDTQVLGISADTPFTNDGWARSMGGLSYPLLSDFWPHGQVCIQYGILREEGLPERAIFVVDKEGIIRYVDVHAISEQPPTDPIMEVLRTLP